MRRRIVTATVVALVLQLLPSNLVLAATGPYTFPFFDHTTIRTQGCHQGCAYDYNLNYEPVASSRDGVVVDVVSGNGVGECDPNTTRRANYVFLRHSDNQHTLYYHLSTVSVTVGQAISAGQQIGVSGESGYSCGPHLHYVLYASATRSDANSLVPDGRWTTDPGRVPWLAKYITEHSPAGYTRLRYTTWTTWVEVRNDGGRTWSWNNDIHGRGRIFLGAVTSSGGVHRDSAFYVSGDWESVSRPGRPDASGILPGNSVRFTFKLYAAPPPGTYNEYFNLGAHLLTYFNYQYFSGFYIPITVTACC